jgi:protein-disulfide isomerase-like protein with CxxC motif
MIAGMMQRNAPLDRYRALVEECTTLSDDALFRICVRSSVGGMMEHGSPRKEYEKIFILCADSLLQEREGQTFCYEAFYSRLPRFFVRDERVPICARFPERFQNECLKAE